MASKIPPFADLPLDKAGPKLNAWGLYGPDDQLGALNRLTPDIVRAASSEIQTGIRMGLDWPLDAMGDLPFFGRRAFHQHIKHKAPRCVNDDEWTFNTQSSTQWDGLRHFAYQGAQKFYNGVTLEDIHGPDAATKNGIGAWAAQGIVGRGVLVDWLAWRDAQNPGEPLDKFDAFHTSSISLEEIKATLKWQGTEIRFGDILFVRSGWMDAYNQMQREEIVSMREGKTTGYGAGFRGVEQTEEVLQWVWENFTAVAGDHPAFEAWPTVRDWSCHEIFLSGWGMPIGELFNLERLAAHCAKEKRWSFFLSSEPCNVPKGVASPPNALAIF